TAVEVFPLCDNTLLARQTGKLVERTQPTRAAIEGAAICCEWKASSMYHLGVAQLDHAVLKWRECIIPCKRKSRKKCSKIRPKFQSSFIRFLHSLAQVFHVAVLFELCLSPRGTKCF